MPWLSSRSKNLGKGKVLTTWPYSHRCCEDNLKGASTLALIHVENPRKGRVLTSWPYSHRCCENNSEGASALALIQVEKPRKRESVDLLVVLSSVL
jgi:hypothetical protein